MNVKQLSDSINIDGKAIRSYARKHFTKPEGNWVFTQSQIDEIEEHFAKRFHASKDLPKKVTGLTENEVQVLDWLVNHGWYAEQGFSDVTAADIAAGIDKPIASVKGYL